MSFCCGISQEDRGSSYYGSSHVRPRHIFCSKGQLRALLNTLHAVEAVARHLKI